ncbi:hypothetical protein BLA29_003450, partial [Euroglyphus maynei]
MKSKIGHASIQSPNEMINKEFQSSASLHETIAEYCEPTISVEKQRKYSPIKSNGVTNTKYQPNSSGRSSSNSNWKNKRRSSVSVLLFGNNNNNNNGEQQQLTNSECQKQTHSMSDKYQRYSSCYTGTTSMDYSQPCHRSSDDILMMSSSTTPNHNINNTTRIYENVQNRSQTNHHKHNNYHHIFPDPARKLTKDSGYESSSSTLVSVARGPTSHNHQHHSSMINMITSSSSSLPSSSCSPETPEKEEKVAESPPPTPPIRYSSLPENYPNTEKIPIDCKTINYCDRQSGFYSNKTKTNCNSNDYVHWSYNLYPKMRRKKQQLHLEENAYDNQMELSLSTPPRSHRNRYSIPSPSSISYGYPSPPVPAQIVYSHRVQPVVRHETNSLIIHQSQQMKQYDSGSQTSASSQPPPPPILPPKTHTSPKNIKEIQKRAVYEFYLRQKEKKKNRSNDGQEETGENQNSLSSSASSSQIKTATYVNDENQNNIIKFK